MTNLGVLSDTTKGSLRTHKGALGSGKNGNRCRYRVCLAEVQSWPGSTSQLSHIDPTNAPNAKWVLNVWHPDGKRERRFFATKDEALAEQTAKEVEAENFGLRALQIDDRLRLEALDAKEKLAPYGVTLTAVVAEFIRRRGSATVTVVQVAEKFLASRSKLERSEKHLDSLRRLFNRFGKSFPTQRLADLTSDQIEGWLHDLGLGPVTVNTYRSLLNSLFEFGVRKNLCPENPVKAVERMTVKAEEVGILTSAQLWNLLEISRKDVRATIALGAFAGIRPEEIARLTWAEVSPEKGHVTITAEKSKTAQHRYVKILPCLEAWLRPLISSGSIQGDNFRRRYARDTSARWIRSARQPAAAA
jgi:integrase